MYEHNALGYWLGLALCLTNVRSSRARCPATALIFSETKRPIKARVLLNSKFGVKNYPVMTLFYFLKRLPMHLNVENC